MTLADVACLSANCCCSPQFQLYSHPIVLGIRYHFISTNLHSLFICEIPLFAAQIQRFFLYQPPQRKSNPLFFLEKSPEDSHVGDDIPIFQASYPPILASGKQILPHKVILGYFPGLALGPWRMPWLLILCTSCSWNGPPKAHQKIIARDRSPESLPWRFGENLPKQVPKYDRYQQSWAHLCVFVNNWCNNCWILMEVWR